MAPAMIPSPMSQAISAATLPPQASPLDISGFTVIKIVLVSIDALVEKEVIPEVSEELSCTRALVDLASAPFFCLEPQSYAMNAPVQHSESRQALVQ